jgi:hypothetical protein
MEEEESIRRSKIVQQENSGWQLIKEEEVRTPEEKMRLCEQEAMRQLMFERKRLLGVCTEFEKGEQTYRQEMTRQEEVELLSIWSLYKQANAFCKGYAQGARVRAEYTSGALKVRLLTEILNLYPEIENTWDALGDLLEEDETVFVRRHPYTKADCYQQALEINQGGSLNWLKLAVALQHFPEKRVQIKNRSYSFVDCYAKVVTLDKKNIQTWILLEGAIGVQTVLISGSEYNRKDCLKKLLELQANNSFLWCRLGDLLTKGEEIVLNQRKYDSAACFIKVIEIDPLNINAWIGLSKVIEDREIIINGMTYSKTMCHAELERLQLLCSQVFQSEKK